MDILPIILGALAALGILFVAYGIAAGPDRVQSRLATLASVESANLEQLELQRPILQRTLTPLIARISRAARRLSSASLESRAARRLAIAGHPGGLSPGEWIGAKVLGGLLLGTLFAGVMLLLGARVPTAAFVGLTGIGVGYIAPEFWLGDRGRARQLAILEMIPDTIDLLAISVRAGLGFDAALERVVTKLDGPLSDEFRQALAEVRVGKPRRDALMDIVPRTEVRPLSGFIAAIIQAERLGVPVATVLDVQSEQMRVDRRQRAEEAASKAPIQMLFPLVGCIFPTLFIVLLGPAIILLQHL